MRGQGGLERDQAGAAGTWEQWGWGSEPSESFCKGVRIGLTRPPLGMRCVSQSLVEVGWALIPSWILVTESVAEWPPPRATL